LIDPAQLRHQQRTDWLPQPEQFRWVYVDFQDARMCHLERLLRYVLTTLDLPVPTPCDLSNFLDVMIEHLHTPTVILLDEIGAALAAPELDLPFWWSLRSLSTNLTEGKLAFLLAAHAMPMQLAQEQGKPSPFFNIFGHVLKIGPLSDAAAHALIASSPKPFDPLDVAWIIEQSQRWPCLLQILCDARLMALEEGLLGETWKVAALEQMEPYRYLLL
ncbi:MAG: ATP-binding protein, partial [Chloroflexi bacterium]|nr:ATP-binding protein [Chloroflexota bacterium]